MEQQYFIYFRKGNKSPLVRLGQPSDSQPDALNRAMAHLTMLHDMGMKNASAIIVSDPDYNAESSPYSALSMGMKDSTLPFGFIPDIEQEPE